MYSYTYIYTYFHIIVAWKLNSNHILFYTFVLDSYLMIIHTVSCPLAPSYDSIHLAPDRIKSHMSVDLHVALLYSVREYFTLVWNLVTAHHLREFYGSQSMPASLSIVRLLWLVVSLAQTSSTAVHGKNKAFHRLLLRHRWPAVALPSNQQGL